jgi:hypothetical protein
MIWLSWRQQRLETLVAAVLVTALAALLIPTGIHMATAYHQAGLAGCTGGARAASCQQALDAFRLRFEQLGSLSAWTTLFPGLIGILLAAPFVSQLEQGTYRLDWTQSYPRRRWIASKLAVAIATALVASLALVVLMTWWRAPLVHLQGRIAPSAYDSQGIVVFGYVLFALAVTLAIGAVWRRAAPALVAGLGVYLAARIVVDMWLRARLAPASSASWDVRGRAPNLDHAWVLHQYVTGADGTPIADLSCPHGASGACQPDTAAGAVHAVYQPAGHFWMLQTRETALFGLVALVLIAFASWWTERSA